MEQIPNLKKKSKMEEIKNGIYSKSYKMHAIQNGRYSKWKRFKIEDIKNGRD